MPVWDDQGPTYRCGAYAARMWLEGAGHDIANTRAWSRWVAMADTQHGLSFEQEHDLIDDFADAIGVAVTWLGDGYLTDFAAFDQAVRGNWFVTVGVWLGDIGRRLGYFHYLDVNGLHGDVFAITDSFSLYDGEAGTEKVGAIHQAIRDNWSATVIGLAWSVARTIVVKPDGPPLPMPGPFVSHGPYEQDLGYEADLQRYVRRIVELSSCANVAAFCAAQSRLETGNGSMFSTRLNFANLGNVDSDPKAGGGFITPEAAAEAWFGFIWNGSPTNTYKPFIAAVEAGEGDVLALARLIQRGGYASSATYAEDVARMAA